MRYIPYFDAHCDALHYCMEHGEALHSHSGQCDLRRLSGYRPWGQMFAIYQDSARCAPEELPRCVSAQLDLYFQARARYGEWMEHCHLSIEGAELIGCDERRLEEVKGWGVRWINLTWNHPNALAAPHTMDRGLTEAGRSFARRARELGIYIDVSHLSDRGFWVLMELDGGAVVASHSNARAVCDHTRNLTDAQITAIIEHQGIIGLNFYRDFVGGCEGLDDVRAHLDHILDLGGAKCVALGGDWDGAQLIPALSHITKLGDFYQYLLGHGYEEGLLQDLFYNNLMGVVRQS